MRSLNKVFLPAALSLLTAFPSLAQNDLKLWYDKPAKVWEEALPLGNAKLGAMVYGGVEEEHYQLNDNTLWSGFPEDGNNPDGRQYLPKVRAAIFAGDYEKAAALWKKMQGPYSARYLPMGELKLDFGPVKSTSYYRDLDLSNAIASVKYQSEGVRYSRETFVSHPDKVMVIHLTADKQKALHFKAALSSKLRYKIKKLSSDHLVLTGKAPKFVANRDYEPEQVVYDDWNGEGMNFEIHLKVRTEGGRSYIEGDELVVSGATKVTLFLSSGTSFNGFDKSPGLEGQNPSLEPLNALEQASGKDFGTLKASHIRDYQSLFNRVSFSLPYREKLLKDPIDQRLMNLKKGVTDLHLQMLYYQFGRYLMISSSRPGSRPTNLQGIWNDHIQPPWGSNYTTNINTEMNYWPAENTNLSECHQPLFAFMEELAVNGAKTAKINYGIAQGWVAHHNSDLWAKTSPPGGYDWDPKGMPRWSAWPMAGAWFCQHLWQHYQFSGDKQFLKDKAYPLMKGASLFMLNWLIEDEASNRLITNPSTSPENTVKIGGKEYQLTKASTMDMSLIRELFVHTIHAAEVLNADEKYQERLKKALRRLYPFHIGRHGQLQEWYGDWDDPNDKHRHLSHLFGLYPGDQITVQEVPELAAAAKQSLIFRGDESTGWSMAWKINWWARLLDGNHAYKMLLSGLNYIDPSNTREQMSGGGAYPNMFDAHPPFQIDGNFGVSAGITEMLLQSHAGELNLLPALPDAWPSGKIEGIKGRGNFEVSMSWDEGRLQSASIVSGSGGPCSLRTSVPVRVLEMETKNTRNKNANPLMADAYHLKYENSFEKEQLQPINQLGAFLIHFETEKGKTYTLVPAR